jgi:hypothetical protein
MVESPLTLMDAIGSICMATLRVTELIVERYSRGADRLSDAHS